MTGNRGNKRLTFCLSAVTSQHKFDMHGFIWILAPSGTIDSTSREGNTIQDSVEKKLGLVKFLKFSSANDAAKPPLRVVGSNLNFPPIFHIVGRGSHGDLLRRICWNSKPIQAASPTV